MALLEWHSPGGRLDIRDGVDSYLIEDGRICAQTIRYTVVDHGLSEIPGDPATS